MKKIVVINSKGGCGKSTLVVALADMLEGQIIDLDHQKTLTTSAKLTDRHVPVDPDKASAEWIIYDTPPYRDASLIGLLKSADHILIPVLIGYPDLLATEPTIDLIVKNKKSEVATIIFNKVRKPHNNAYKEIKSFFEDNYTHIKMAKTELSELKGYQNILAQELKGKARQEVQALVKELL